MIEIRAVDPGEPAVAALLAYHHADAHRRFPSEFAHALPPERLRDPSITLFAAFDGDALLGIAALRRLDDGDGELKSMRTHPERLRRGTAQRLLDHIVAEARARGLSRLSLETGTTPEFAAANALYEAAGFIDGPVFGGYPPSAYNRFMTREL